jgi:hypothetical protein
VHYCKDVQDFNQRAATRTTTSVQYCNIFSNVHLLLFCRTGRRSYIIELSLATPLYTGKTLSRFTFTANAACPPSGLVFVPVL